MRRRLKALWANEDGSAMALVAISLTALVSLMALGIDVGMLFNARSEAQRAADSAALAGASAFLDYPAKEAPKPAQERAVEYAVQNEIRNVAIREDEVAVFVNVDSATVTVRVHRDGVSTWFARIFGRTDVPIGAQATAQASNAGTAQCVKPFAVPDLWEETTDDTNRNRIWDDERDLAVGPRARPLRGLFWRRRLGDGDRLRQRLAGRVPGRERQTLRPGLRSPDHDQAHGPARRLRAVLLLSVGPSGRREPARLR